MRATSASLMRMLRKYASIGRPGVQLQGKNAAEFPESCRSAGLEPFSLSWM